MAKRFWCHVIFIVLGTHDCVIQCHNGDCKFTIVGGTECNNCCTDNTLEALEAAFKELKVKGLEEFSKFMLVHFPLKEIREKHVIRLISIEKENQEVPKESKNRNLAKKKI